MQRPHRVHRYAFLPALLVLVIGSYGHVSAQSTCLEVEPDSLEFYGDLCDGWLYQENIEYQPIYIFALCGDTGYYWEISADQPWVGFTPAWGWDSDSVLVYIDKEQLIDLVPDSLPPGDTLRLEATLTVTGDPLSPPQTVMVSLLLACTPPNLLLMVQPPELFIEAPPGDTLQRMLWVYEAHGASVLFDYYNLSSWLTLPVPFAPLYTPDSVGAFITTAGLTPGVYQDTIFVSAYPDSASSPVQTVAVPVTLVVNDGDVMLATSPDYFHFTLPPGGTAAESLLVYEIHGQSIGLWLYNAADWLHIDTVSAIPLYTPEVLGIHVNAASLAPGYYSDTIFVFSAGADNTPLLVPVTLEVTGGGGGYVVQTVPSAFNVVLSEGEGAVDSLHVFEIHGHNAPFFFSNTQPWLALDPFPMPPYATPYTMVTSFGTHNLPPGTYVDTIVVFPVHPDYVFDTVRVPVMVTIYGGPVLVASPDHFEFVAVPGDELTHQGFLVYETHGDSVVFGADVMGGSLWLDIEDTTPYGIYWTPDSVFFSVYATELSPGFYADTIVLYPPFDSIPFPPVTVPVYLYVDTGGYQLVVDPQSFNYTVHRDHFFYDYLHIEELHGRTLLLSFYNTQPWLSIPLFFVPPPTPMMLEFGISTDSLLPGTYNDVITIFGYLPDSGYPPVDVAHVPVTLTVIEGQPFEVRAAPDHFEYVLHQGTHFITDQFLVYDLDSANLPFAVTQVNNSDWLEIDTSTMSGVTPSHVIFYVSTAGLEPGTYGDSIVVYYPLDDMYGFDDVLVPVILHVLSDTLNAVVATEPESFEFVVPQGAVHTDELHVYEIHGGTVPFHMWNQTSWLNFGFCLAIPYVTPYTAPIVVNTDSLPPGNYFDTITIWPDTDGVSFPPVHVPVSLTVLPPGGGSNDSLIIPSISVTPCDWSCVVQPVQTKLSQPIKGATVPIAIPDGVTICSLSTAGLITEGWDWTFSEVNDSLGFVFMALANSFDARIPVGVTTVFNIHFNVDPLCRESRYFRWDTTLMLDVSRHLALTDTAYNTIHPGFDMLRDSVEVTGYTPGDFDVDRIVTISDLVSVVDYMFMYGPPPCVMNALDVNGDCIGPDISDLVALIDYMFMPWDPLPEFPPELACGCISEEGGAVAKLNRDITIAAVRENGATTLILTSPLNLRGLQLELRVRGGGGMEKLVDDRLDLVVGENDGRVRLGILDLDGANIIAAGETPLVRLGGEVEVIEVVVADGQYRSMRAYLYGVGDGLPQGYLLSQNYPNPFNPLTEISLSLPAAAVVRLEVFNIVGQKVTTLHSGALDAGDHVFSWDARDMSSGVYFYKLTAPDFSASRKMVLLK